MSLYRQKASKYWHCRFTVGGEEIRRSTRTTNRKQAAEFEHRLREQAWREIVLGEPARHFEEAAIQWLDEKASKRSLHSDKAIIAWFRPHLAGLKLSEITPDLIAELRTLKRAESSAATANRHFAWLRSMLRAARTWGWIDSVPTVPMYRLEKPEPRWITPEEVSTLCALLPEYLARCAWFAVATGLRAGAIHSLEWSQVDEGRRLVLVPVSKSKNAKPLRVPLNDRAMQAIRQCKNGESGKHPRWVFTKDGEQVPYWFCGKPWKRAVRAAGLDPLRFHDLRHTWASWHVQAGTPLHILQALGGWSSITMVQRYAHLAPSDVDRWAANCG